MVIVKRERLASFEVKSESKVSVDRISALPKEVLGIILSFLTLKEATATSILGRSWKYLWTLTPNLNLEGPQERAPILDFEPFLIKERCKYIRWVYHVIALHQMSNLEEFKVLFDLSASHTHCIDEWLSYALSRKAQRLELSLVDFTGIRTNRNHHLCYSFPYKDGNLPDNFKRLKQLSLHLVNVSGEAVGFFLRNCPLLERVSVSQSQVMSSLEIIQPYPSFECLEIDLCHKLKSVVIRDSNVVNIKFNGRRIGHFVLINLPLLTELWIEGLVTECMQDVGKMFASVLPQLEIFKIKFFYHGLSLKDCIKFASAVEMNNLKQMVVNIYHCRKDRDYLLPVINLISASPCLQRFVFEAPRLRSENEVLLDANREVFKMIPRAYSSHLKEIECVGYSGGVRQHELIMHFVHYNVALENIVVDPRCLATRLHCPWERIFQHNEDEEIFARAYAKEQLEEHVPSRISLNII